MTNRRLITTDNNGSIVRVITYPDARASLNSLLGKYQVNPDVTERLLDEYFKYLEGAK